VSTENRRLFSNRLQELLDEENLSQTELAKRVGVHKSLVSNWISGARGIDSENLLAVARVFGVTPAYVKGATEDRFGPPGLLSDRVTKMIEGYAANANVASSDFLEYLVENFSEAAARKIKAGAVSSSSAPVPSSPTLRKAAEEFQEPEDPSR
jgi:transcriptional regulator with XRE-family HTH domain